MEETFEKSAADKKKHAVEVSDSSSSSAVIQPVKRQKLNGNVASSSFKGVVLQQNGNWGAQIYANHQRIWLGTFKSEREAAKAYDSAAIKVRGRDLHRNIPWTNVTIQEPSFQSQFSTGTVLSMIKDGSYESKFVDYLKEQCRLEPNLLSSTGEEFFCKKLFHKELTPSDVSKLNRLVIPKRYAVMHFPGSSGDQREIISHGVGDSDIICYDRFNTEWKFRYCYWKSSQSFVFTRGWNGFVKAKHLRAKDTVTFFSCEHKGSPRETKPAFVIDVEYHNATQGGQPLSILEKDLLHNLQQENDLLEALDKKSELIQKESNGSVIPAGFRLFGVQIA